MSYAFWEGNEDNEIADLDYTVKVDGKVDGYLITKICNLDLKEAPEVIDPPTDQLYAFSNKEIVVSFSIIDE